MKFPSVVLGSSLSAALYAFLKGLPYFPSSKNFLPPFYEFFPTDLDLDYVYPVWEFNSFLKKDNHYTTFGPRYTHVYKHLCFLLSLAGLMPLSGKIESISLFNQDFSVHVEGQRHDVETDGVIHVFSDIGVLNIDAETNVEAGPPVHTVYDWFLPLYFPRTGFYEYLYNNDKFVNEIFFSKHIVPRGRTTKFTSVDLQNVAYSSFINIQETPKKHKDLALSKSYLTEEELENENYSEFLSRFKVEKILKKNEFRGERAIIRSWKNRERSKVEYKIADIELQPYKRVIHRQFSSYYRDTDVLKFHYESPEEIVADIGQRLNFPKPLLDTPLEKLSKFFDTKNRPSNSLMRQHGTFRLYKKYTEKVIE